jgi:hypothetical protein
MEESLTNYLSHLLEDGLTRYEILPFIVVLGLLCYVWYTETKK